MENNVTWISTLDISTMTQEQLNVHLKLVVEDQESLRVERNLAMNSKDENLILTINKKIKQCSIFENKIIKQLKIFNKK